MRIWIPGPTHVRPAILGECSREMIGHRSSAMSALFERIDPPLARCFGLGPRSTSRVAVHTASATGWMEAALLGVPDNVLVVVHGAFAKRWLEIARLVRKRALVLEMPAGTAPSAARMLEELERQAPVDALAVVLNETSTGVRMPREWLAQVRAARPDLLLLVDVVSYLAGAPLEFDTVGLDFAFAGSQKALALPPGLAVACASARYLEQARARPRASFYLDPVRIFDGHARRETPATPCIPLYYALARQLEDIDSGRVLDPSPSTGEAAWQARYERHQRLFERTSAWAAPHIAAGKMRFLAEPALRSPTVSHLLAEGFDATAFLREIERAGHKLGSGYGDLKGKAFRIGHMGDHTLDDLEDLLQQAERALRLQA